MSDHSHSPAAPSSLLRLQHSRPHAKPDEPGLCALEDYTCLTGESFAMRSLRAQLRRAALPHRPHHRGNWYRERDRRSRSSPSHLRNRRHLHHPQRPIPLCRTARDHISPRNTELHRLSRHQPRPQHSVPRRCRRPHPRRTVRSSSVTQAHLRPPWRPGTTAPHLRHRPRSPQPLWCRPLRPQPLSHHLRRRSSPASASLPP